MNEPKKKLLSIIIPVYNEEENVESFYEKIASVMKNDLVNCRYELIFTDNHSTDQTFEKLEQLSKIDSRIRVFRFSKNFGYQRSIYTGYMIAKGDAAIQIDCDFQDPPELIPEFVKLWEIGYHVVYGIRISREEGFVVTSLRKVFYRLIDYLSEEPLPFDAGDFRLIDRRIIEELKKIKDYQPYLRGTISNMGFKQIGIEYQRGIRIKGVSKFSWNQLLQLALDGILNHSIVPLRISTYMGIIVSVLTILCSSYYFIRKLVLNEYWPAGIATIIILILLSLGINSLFLGVIGEYLGRIFRQVKMGPITIIERTIDSSSSKN